MVEQDCTTEIYDSTFLKNRAYQSNSVLKAKSAKKVFIQNSIFVDNAAAAQIFYFQSSNDVTIKDCIFKDNKASQITPGFNLQSSVLNL